MQRGAAIVYLQTPVQAGTAVQGDGADMVLIQMLMHFEIIGLAVQAGIKCLVQRRQGVAGDDHNRAMHLGDVSDDARVTLRSPGRRVMQRQLVHILLATQVYKSYLQCHFTTEYV
jgi:hypothetical protein